MTTTIPCDGCLQPHSPSSLTIFVAQGVQVRYCADCAKHWASFEDAHNTMATRLQRELELWRESARKNLPLHVTPLDFPALSNVATGHGLVLG